MYMRIGVEGAERRVAGTRILVANHQSWLDPLVLMGIEPRLAGPVRRYMLRVPIFGTVARLAGFFQSDVGELPSLDEVARCVADARARGGSLLFFPEGTRSKDGALGPFHRGAFRTAFDHGLAIQPVVIEGLDRVLPRHGPIVQTYGRTLVRVRYLAPIAPPFEIPGVPRRDVVRGLAERARTAIAEELEAMRKSRTGPDDPVDHPRARKSTFVSSSPNTRFSNRTRSTRTSANTRASASAKRGLSAYDHTPSTPPGARWRRARARPGSL